MKNFKKYAGRGVLVILAAILFINAYQGNVSDGEKYLSRGDTLFSIQQYDSAFFCYAEAAKIFAKGADHSNNVKALTHAGKSLLAQRQIRKTIEYLQKHEDLVNKADQQDEAVEDFYNTLVEAYYHEGNAYGALEYHSKVYKINLEKADVSDDKMIEVVRLMGVLYFNSGQLSNAIIYYSQYAERLTKKYGDQHLLLSDAYNYLGMVYRYMGEYDLAKDYYTKAIVNAENYTREERQAINPRFASISPLYNNISNIYHDLKQDTLALEYSMKALNIRIAEKEESHHAVAVIYSGLGGTYLQMKDYDKALYYRKKSLVMRQKEYGENHGVVAMSLKSIGDIYFEMDNIKEAKKFYQQSLDMNLKVQGPLHPNTADSYVTLSRVLEREGDMEGALQRVQQAIKIMVHDFEDSESIYANPDSRAATTIRLQLLEEIIRKGDLLRKYYNVTNNDRDLQASFDCFTLAIEVSEEMRNNFVDNRSKSYLSENVKSLYEKAIQSAHQLYQLTGKEEYLTAAFATMEKNKSRLLLESIQNSQMKNSLDLPDSLFNLENSLKSEISFHEERILDEEVSKEKDEEKIKGLQEELFNSRRKLEFLITSFKENYPHYHSAKYATPDLRPSAIQSDFLKGNDILLEFFEGDSALYMFSVSKDEIKLVALDTVVHRYTEQMLRGVQKKDFHQYAENAFWLYNTLLKPVVGSDTTDRKIIIVPDGIVSYIPFELLLTTKPAAESYASLAYSIRRFNFNYRFSSALMSNNFQKKNHSTNQLAGFAPTFQGNVVAQRGLPGNIPYAKKEVDDIAQTFEGKIYTGTEATETNFRNLTENYNVIHLATHAIIDEDNPNLSRLYFAQDSVQDGMLHAYELFSLNITADLVTLSACNTAIGQWKEGEGAMSLSRAFAYAGCPSTVTSLWPAQDQTTAEIMKYFYDNLSNGMAKDDALREAKLMFLDKTDKIKSSPFYWAGFILVGDNTPLNSNKFNGWIFVGGLVVLLGGISFIAWIRKNRTVVH